MACFEGKKSLQHTRKEIQKNYSGNVRKTLLVFPHQPTIPKYN